MEFEEVRQERRCGDALGTRLVKVLVPKRSAAQTSADRLSAEDRIALARGRQAQLDDRIAALERAAAQQRADDARRARYATPEGEFAALVEDHMKSGLDMRRATSRVARDNPVLYRQLTMGGRRG